METGDEGLLWNDGEDGAKVLGDGGAAEKQKKVGVGRTGSA